MGTETAPDRDHRERLLRSLAAAAFFIFFNGYMLAPLIPALSREFGADPSRVGWIIPAYLLPYGASTLFYGPLSDRVGRRRVLLTLLALSTLVALLSMRATDLTELVALRVAAGLCAGGIVPIALALVGDLFAYGELGRAMGWMFGAIAGGMSFGSTLGVWLNPYLGWRGEFGALAAANFATLVWIARSSRASSAAGDRSRRSFTEVFRGYGELLRDARGRSLYALIFLNGLFHSGVFSWLGFYFVRRYGLGDAGIGAALLGYGLPGMFLGPPLGRLADRLGRRRIVPIGFLIAAACAFALIPASPVALAAAWVTILSIGFDMTHPLLAGLVAALAPARRGQAMGLNAFAVFTGFGSGALIFQCLVSRGLGFALGVFGTLPVMLALFSRRALRSA